MKRLALTHVASIFVLLALLTGCGDGIGTGGVGIVGGVATSAPTDGSALPVPSEWRGEIAGEVFKENFRLPVTIELTAPLPEEFNPVHVFLGAPDVRSIGGVSVYSAWSTFTPITGREVTLQYFTVQLQGSQLQAELTDDHKSQAAAMNMFTAPNVTVQFAPAGPGQAVSDTGPTETFLFLKGTKLEMRLEGSSLKGNISGKGTSLTGLFPIPDVIYQGEFTSSRVK